MLDLARTYRRVVLERRTHTLYRRRLIERYRAAKRLALARWPAEHTHDSGVEIDSCPRCAAIADAAVWAQR